MIDSKVFDDPRVLDVVSDGVIFYKEIAAVGKGKGAGTIIVGLGGMLNDLKNSTNMTDEEIYSTIQASARIWKELIINLEKRGETS